MNKYFLKIIVNNGLVGVATQTFNMYLIWYFAVILHRQDMVALLSTLQVIDIVLGPVGGSFADMNNPIKIIKIASTFRIMITIILISSAFMIKVDFKIIVLLISSLLLNLIEDFYSPAVAVTAYKLSKNDVEQVKNNAGFEAVNSMISIFSAILIGVMTTYLNFEYSIFVIVILIFFSNIFILKSNLPDSDNTRNKVSINIKGIFKKTLSGTRAIFKEKVIVTIIPYVVMANFLYWLFWYVQPLYLSQKIPTMKSAFSIQQFVIAIFSIVATIYVQKKNTLIMTYLKKYRILLIMQSSALLILALVYSSNNNKTALVVGLVVLWALYSILNTLTGIMMLVIIQNKIDEKLLGTSLGTVFSILMGMSPVAGMVSGIVNIDAKTLIIISGLMVIIFILSLFDRRFSEVLNND